LRTMVTSSFIKTNTVRPLAIQSSLKIYTTPMRRRRSSAILLITLHEFACLVF
jgi:hypothetical protein